MRKVIKEILSLTMTLLHKSLSYLFMKTIFVVFLIGLFVSPAYAGKVETLRKEIASSCGKVDLNRKDLIKLVRKSYLACRPGNNVQVTDSCQISCLRRNQGNVIGKR